MRIIYILVVFFRRVQSRGVEMRRKVDLSYLLDNPAINLWLKKACSSEESKRSYLQTINRFFKATNLDPTEILEKWNKIRYNFKEREKFLNEIAKIVEEYYWTNLDGQTPMSKRTILTTILSFFKHNKIPLEVDCKERIYVKYHNRAISKEEIRRILEQASLRDRCFFLIMVESGLRPDTIVKLRYKNIKEDFEAGKIPMKIVLDPEILKDRVGIRFTFIGEDGYKTLKEYLAPRMPLKDDDVIFKGVHTRQQKGEYLSPNLFAVQFAKIVKKLNLCEQRGKRRPLTLYSLRKYFRNQIKVSDPAYREFWMGHSLGTDAHYFYRWLDDPNIVEQHRQEYAKAYPSIRIYEPTETSKAKELEIKLNQAYLTIGELNLMINELRRELAEYKAIFGSIEDLKAVQEKTGGNTIAQTMVNVVKLYETLRTMIGLRNEQKPT